METAGTMTGFAAGRRGIGSAGCETGVTGGGEMPDQFVVAFRASGISDERGAWNRRWRHDCAGEGAARNGDGSEHATGKKQADVAVG